MSENGNEAKDLSLTLAKNIVESVTDAFGISKPLQFALCIDMGLGAEQAGKIVGYKPRYSYELRRKFKNSREHRAKLAEVTARLPDWYRSACKAKLPMLAAAEALAIGKYLENPELLIDKPQLAKQIKMASGVRTDEPQQQGGVTVAVQLNIQRAMAQQLDEIMAEQSGEVIDLETND